MSQFLEYLKMAVANIRANKMRSLLTMLGIIIGISSVILIMSVGNGAKNIITDEMADIGINQIAIYSYDKTILCGHFPFLSLHDTERRRFL